MQSAIGLRGRPRVDRALTALSEKEVHSRLSKLQTMLFLFRG
jgi:hypothetical protein